MGLFIPCAFAPALAQPIGGSVVAGQATITQPSLHSTLISQASAKAIIDWQQFSLTSGQSVQFAQPNASAITLNRVTGGGLSAIAGSITANGQIWLINPNGVMFGQGATVNVGGLLATTSDIANGDFLTGNYAFGGAPSGSAVVNKGTISAGTGGSVVLSAPRVVNKGIITAHAGHVVLGAADAFTVDFDGDHLLSYQVQTPAPGAGGTVLMTRRAAAQVQRGVVNDKGMTEATSVRIENGEVVLDGGDGAVTSSGTVDVSGKGQAGGTVEIQGKSVTVADGARIDASGDGGGGTILIGGNFHGAGPQLNSQSTTVGKAVITADAVASGDGGKVAVWSDGKTEVSAAISARGGALSGNGGQVETSGHVLQVSDSTTVDTTAPNGAVGTWLLDPGTINISTGGGTALGGDNGYTFADDPSTGDSVTIAPATITTALANGNVLLEANSAINTNAALSYNSGYSLTLLSKGSITVGNGGIQNSGAGSIVLVAGWDGSSLPTALAATNTYGLSTSGVIQLQGSDASVGSASGAVYLSAYGLSLQDSGGTSYAQVGYHGAGGGDIYIQTLSGTSSLTTYGVNLNESYGGTTQIGNGGYDGAITGAAIGNISIITTGTTTVATYSGTAKIGNYAGSNGESGTVSLTTGTLTNGGASVAYGVNTFITDNVGTGAGTGGDVSLTLTAATGATTINTLSYSSPHNVSLATNDAFGFAGGITNTGTGSLSLTSGLTLLDTAPITLGGRLNVTTTANNADITLSNTANAVTGAVLLNTTLGNATFVNDVSTTLGVPVADDSNPALYNFVINGNLSVTDRAGSLTLDGRLHVKGTGDTTLEASGDLINNNGDGTIYADRLNLISDSGGIGTGSWTFGDGSQSGGTLNLFLSANNGAGTAQINPGDVNFGGTAMATTQGYSALAGSLLVFGNGLVQQDAGASGILKVGTGNLDIHATGAVTLTNTLNDVTGTAYFRTPGAISFTNSVNTTIGRANGGGLDINNNPNTASAVTITVHDGVGATSPTLTLKNSSDLDTSSVSHLTSIDSSGTVTLSGDGAISDGYTSVTSSGNAGHITAAILNVTSSTAGISLLNPTNNVTYDGINAVSLNGGHSATGVGFTNSQGILLQLFTSAGNFDITTNDTNSPGTHSVIEIFGVGAPDTSAGPSLLHASGNIYNKFAPGPGLQAKSFALVSDHGAIGASGSPITLSPVTSGTPQVVQAQAAGDIYLESFQAFTISNLGLTDLSGAAIGTHGITAGGTVNIFLNTSGNGTNLSQSGDAAITAATLTIEDDNTPGSRIILDNAANSITGLVQLTGLSDVTLMNSVSTLMGASSATGVLKIVSSGDITINASAVLSSGATGDGAIVLAATGNFINNSGSGALSEPNGAFQIYSSDPTGDTFGGLDSGNTAVWDTAAGSPITATGDRYIFAFQPTLTFTASNLTKVYGDTPSLASSYGVSGYQTAVTGAYLGDSATNVFSGTPTVSSPGAAVTATVAGSPYTISVGTSSLTDLDNYAFATVNAQLTVSAKALSITALAQSKTYGASLVLNSTAFSVGSGLINGDTVTGVTLASSGTAAGAGAGSYAITPSSAVGSGVGNYAITYNPGILTVAQATLSYVADAGSRAYGAPNPFLTGSVTGFVNGDTLTSATTGSLAFSSSASATDGVGNYAVTGFGLSASNYAFVQAAGNATALTINPATLSYVANTASKTYGDANPAFSGTVTGFVNSDTQANATTGRLLFDSPATSGSGIGLYAINGSGLSASNYTFVQAGGNGGALTINRATLSYVAAPASKTYGSFNPTLGGTVTGFVNGDTQTSATTGSLLFASSASTGSGVGSYAVTGSGLSAANYTFSQAVGNSTDLTINPATLTYAASSVTRTYGTASPAFSGTVTGFVNGDTQASATTGALTFGSSAATGSNVGSYAINGSGLGAGNYIFVQAAGNSAALTINPASLSYVATAASKTYGAADPVFGGTVTGFVNGDTQKTATTGTLAFTSPATAGSNVGAYAIDGSGLTANGNYVLSQAGANATALTINQATLSYVANAAIRVYGGANPFLTGSVTGFVNGDTQTSATTGSLAFSSPATTSSGVGTYAVNGFGLSARNYVFVQAAGNSVALSVNPATLTYAANSVTRTYGAANPVFAGTVTGFVNGDTQASATTGTLVFASAATAGSNIGRYAIDGSGLSASNYVFVQKSSNVNALAINPATLIYIADAASATYGAALPTLSGTVAGFVNGDTLASATNGTPVFNFVAGNASGVGSYAITGSGLAARNYVFLQSSFNATALTITPATLTAALTGTVTKPFDGTTVATLSSANYAPLQGILGGDAVTLASLPVTGAYDSTTVGTGKMVTVSGLTLSGASAANYVLASSVVSAPIGVITASVSATDPGLLSVVVYSPQTPMPYLTFVPAISIIVGPGGLGAPVLTSSQAVQVVASVTPNPIAALAQSGTGDAPAAEPPAPADAATDFIVQSMNGAPKASASPVNVIIPGILHAETGQKPPPPGTGETLSAWGNSSLWQ